MSKECSNMLVVQTKESISKIGRYLLNLQNVSDDILIYNGNADYSLTEGEGIVVLTTTTRRDSLYSIMEIAIKEIIASLDSDAEVTLFTEFDNGDDTWFNLYNNDLDKTDLDFKAYYDEDTEEDPVSVIETIIETYFADLSESDQQLITETFNKYWVE